MMDKEISEYPSPSNDSWFDDEANLAIVNQGIDDVKNGRVRELSLNEINSILGLNNINFEGIV